MSLSGKCPFHNTSSGDIIGENIRRHVHSLKQGVNLIIDTPEKEQAVFAYRIYQLAQDIPELESYLGGFSEIMDEDEEAFSYKAFSDAMKRHLIQFGSGFFTKIDPNEVRVSRLLAGLDTFHAFVKRAVIIAKKENTGDALFPYKEAIQLASTSIERANILAIDPEIKGWEGLFFDPSVDISKMYLGVPISKPIYKCPVLYSGEFRNIIDSYFQILSDGWEKSKDRPRELSVFHE